jgi:hypothetical protein
MTTQETEEQRLRRELRAMGAVNRQLQAQLEGGGYVAISSASTGEGGDLLAPTAGAFRAGNLRRGSDASRWIQQLERDAASGPPALVRASSGKAFVVEGNRRREVRAGLLIPALEQLLGEARPVDDGELDRWIESAPVEVLEGPRGAPFVIVGGKRWPLRGLPVPYPVGTEQMYLFPEGSELNVAATNVSRSRFQRAVTGRYQLERAREVMRRQGPVKGAAAIARRAVGRMKRGAGRAS